MAIPCRNSRALLIAGFVAVYVSGGCGSSDPAKKVSDGDAGTGGAAKGGSGGSATGGSVGAAGRAAAGGGTPSSGGGGSNGGGGAGQPGGGGSTAGGQGGSGAMDAGDASDGGGGTGGDGGAVCPDAGGTRAVYGNDFETDTAGFDATATIALPSDATNGVSTYLGARTPVVSTGAVLTLTGLTPGETYFVAFDLFLGGTWDGGVGFGPDTFSLTSSSSGLLVDATFRNGFPIGDATPTQSYSDATPLGGAVLFRTREGADVELAEPIYYFGHGAGNPRPSFIAAASTETLTFRSVDSQGVNDEFFALDNVSVSRPCP